MGLRVLSTNGRPINGYQAVMRNLMRSVDVSIFLLLTLIVMACNRRFQRLGDLVCGTMVVAEEQPWLGGVAKIEDPRAFQLASYLPADLQISRSMAQALAHYAEPAVLHGSATAGGSGAHCGALTEAVSFATQYQL